MSDKIEFQMFTAPTDIIVSGFNMRETILDVLKEELDEFIDHEDLEDIAYKIQDAFKLKLRMKQGEK